jgi:hypothetical protein
MAGDLAGPHDFARMLTKATDKERARLSLALQPWRRQERRVFAQRRDASKYYRHE